MNARRRAVIAALVSLVFVLELPVPVHESSERGASSAVAGAADAQAPRVRPMARVMVPEPARRTPLPALSASARRGQPAAIARRVYGTRLAGPPMVPPARFAALRTLRLVEPSAARAVGAPARTVRPRSPAALVAPALAGCVTASPVPAPTPGAAGVRPSTPAPNTVAGCSSPPPGPTPTPGSTPPPALAASGTGINPWWRYQEENVPGGDHLMVNVGTGNLIVQSEDMDVPHRGIALAFRRTYNSQSEHDAYGTDGAQPGMYGNGWTNTFDAHIVKAANGTVSVYDIDGARYDYVPAPTGGYAPPPGQHARLAFDGACGFLWTKKTGTVYQFYRPTMSGAGCSSPDSAYAGRLHAVFGRNQNTVVTLAYAWDNGFAGAGGKISQIVAATESGLAATLTFADFNGSRLLQSLARPDGAQIAYAYDTSFNLKTAALPANNAAGTPVVKSYGYGSWPGGNPAGVMNSMASPRWSNAGGADGEFLQIGSTFTGPDNAHASLAEIDHLGFVDPAPPDKTNPNTPIQPAPANGAGSAVVPFLAEYFGLGTLGTASTPTFRDSDGHSTTWVTDAAGRPNQTQECALTQNQQCTGTVLVTGEQWDASNELVAQVEPRGFAPGAVQGQYETDYAYDANGNTVAMAAPPVTVAQGTFRPTSLYAYDASNNVTAACDPAWSHANGRDWNVTGPPGASDSLCPTVAGNPSAPGPVVYQYQYPAQEPYGELVGATSQLGYQRTFGYGTGTSDFGLPLSVSGAPFAQSDGSTFRESKAFGYDGNGNLTAYGTGSGTWTLAYDVLGRLVSATDPDNVTTRTCYYPDGSVRAKQTALQYVLDGAACGSNAVAYAYDLDGNVTSETHHFGNATGVTTKWYDGLDRLVEVQQPSDPTDYQPYPWMTRYVYDLSQAGTMGAAPAVNGTPVTGYGNLFKTMEYMPPTAAGQPTNLSAAPQWVDLRGTSYDALDRATASYEAAFGAAPKQTNQYDLYGQLGLLARSANAVGQADVLGYDALGRKTSDTYSGDNGLTPGRSLLYDVSGQVAAVTASDLGSERYTYDAEGRKATMTEPTGGNVDSPAAVTYAYYPNGLRRQVAMASAAFALPVSFAYAYRADTKLQTESFSNQYGAYPFGYAYSPAGRMLRRQDPLTGATVGAATIRNPSGTSYTMGAETMVPQTYQYDANGNLSGLTIPRGGSYSAFTRDAEGEVTSFNGYAIANSPFAGATESISYSSRGEVLLDSIVCAGVSACTDQAGPRHYFNGYGYGASADMRSGQNYGITTPTQQGIDFRYDAAGRLTGSDSRYVTFNATMASVPYTRTYDAEDHIRAQTVGGGAAAQYVTSFAPCGAGVGQTPAGVYPASMTFSYWPDGHAAAIADSGIDGNNAPYGTQTWHWDGDTLLYISKSDGYGGHDASVYLGRDAIFGMVPQVAATAINVLDRDWTGTAVSAHSLANGTYAYAGWAGQGPAARVNCKTGNSSLLYPPSSQGDEAVADGGVSHRSDGYVADVITFQGVRTYDPNAGQWTTPDAYAGDVHDPMSQKPFMWNRNNAFEYEDLDGRYSTGIAPRGLSGSEDGLATSEVFTAVLSATGPSILDLATDPAPVEVAANSRKRENKGKGTDQTKLPGWVMKMLGEVAAKPPAGSKPINQTPYTKYHREIKNAVGSNAADSTYISPTHDVWTKNGDGTWTNQGSADNMFHSSKK